MVDLEENKITLLKVQEIAPIILSPSNGFSFDLQHKHSMDFSENLEIKLTDKIFVKFSRNSSLLCSTCQIPIKEFQNLFYKEEIFICNKCYENLNQNKDAYKNFNSKLNLVQSEYDKISKSFNNIKRRIIQDNIKEISQVLSDTKEEIGIFLENNFQELFKFDFTKKILNIKNLMTSISIKQHDDSSLNEHIIRDIINGDINLNTANKELKEFARSNCVFLDDCNESIITQEVDKEKTKNLVKLLVDILLKSIVLNCRADELNTIGPLIQNNQMIDNLHAPIGIIDETTFALEKELECLNLEDNKKKIFPSMTDLNKNSFHLDVVNSTMLRKRERNSKNNHYENGDKEEGHKKSINLLGKWEAHTSLIDNSNISVNKSTDSQGKPHGKGQSKFRKKDVNFGGNHNIIFIFQIPKFIGTQQQVYNYLREYYPDINVINVVMDRTDPQSYLARMYFDCDKISEYYDSLLDPYVVNINGYILKIEKDYRKMPYPVLCCSKMKRESYNQTSSSKIEIIQEINEVIDLIDD